MVDPFSIAVTVLAIYAMLKRSPQWAGEMADEWRAAKRGEESPAAHARRQRLIDAGIDPATGGPMRQYLGNRWRDYWLDADRQATNRRDARRVKEEAGEALSWRERLNARMDDEANRRAEQWRTRPAADTAPPVNFHPQPDPTPNSTNNPSGGEQQGRREHPERPGSGHTEYPHPDPAPIPDEPESPRGGTTHTNDTPPTAGQPSDTREPIRVDVQVGEPLRSPTEQPTAAPAAITAGGTMSNAVAQQTVTGVVSGAAEARAIQNAINAATEEYVARLTRLRGRIASLGEQTLTTVQMSTRSQVVANTAAAAEAAAAATANARACTAEVVPLLGAVARAFDRVNS